MLLALAFLVAYAWPVINENLGHGLQEFFGIVSWTVWGVFAFDFAARLYLADDARSYAVKHWYDVLLIGLPVLRPLRLLRLLALARVPNRSAAGSLVGQVATYVVGAAVSATALGAIDHQHRIGDPLRWHADLGLWRPAERKSQEVVAGHLVLTSTA